MLKTMLKTMLKKFKTMCETTDSSQCECNYCTAHCRAKETKVKQIPMTRPTQAVTNNFYTGAYKTKKVEKFTPAMGMSYF